MIVTMRKRGNTVTGLNIGISNVLRYFRPDLKAVDLELDHLHIRCELQASFWRDRPEISDPRLCTWLQSKLFREKKPENPVSVEMVRAGDGYRLALAASIASYLTSGIGQMSAFRQFLQSTRSNGNAEAACI